VGEQHALYFAKRGDGDAIENIILVSEEDLDDADERGV